MRGGPDRPPGPIVPCGRRAQRRERELGDVPAVALTAYAQPRDERRAMMAGFQRFVAKPVEPDELAAVVRTLVPAADTH